MTLSAGSQLGPYEIVDAIGSGGMGEVYRARDTKLNRDVAIKVLPELFALVPERLARFKREAQLLAALNHPHIAQIYGLEDAQGISALVMELVEGPTLADRIAAGPMPIDEALPIAKQIAEALEAAHEHGIVHRDLKPANIKVTDDGTVKVLDFGLAKALDRSGGAGGVELTNSPTLTSPAMMTGAGVILGTAAYMAPEQAKGRPVDKRADIWAFGCVLYEMLTGCRAFVGDDLTDTLTAIMRDAPAWDALPTGTPPAVRALLARCLDKDPRQRLRDIGEARVALGGDLAPAPPTPAAARGPGRFWRSVGAMAAIVLAAGGAGSWITGRFRSVVPPVSRVQFAVSLPNGLQVLRESSLAVAPDGRSIAFVAPLPGQVAQLWIHGLADGQTRSLAGTDGAMRPAWSPDGRFLAFFASGFIRKIPASGGPVETVCSVADFAFEGFGLTWNAGGTIVFSANLAGGLRQVPASGGTAVPLTEPDRAKGESGHMWPRFLSDGRRVIYSVGRSGSGERALMIQSIETGGPRHLTDIPAGAVPFSDQALLFLRGRALVAQPFDSDKVRIAGAAATVADRLSVSDGTFDAAGDTLAYLSADRQTSLAWFDRIGRRLSPVDVDGMVNWPAVAPDGRRIAVDIENLASGVREIWAIDGTRRSRLTFGPANDSDAIWAPDGERLAFAHDSGRQLRELTIGQSASRLLHDFGSNSDEVYPTDWSRDGRLIAFVSWGPEGNSNIWLFPTSGEGTPQRLVATPFQEGQARFSPDGRYVAYTSNDSGRPEVYIQALPPGNGRWPVSTSGGAQPMWRGDGRELYYVALDNTMTAVPVTLSPGVGIGTPAPLFKVEEDESLFYAVRNHYSVTADGQRFLVNSVKGGTRLNVVLNWARGLVTRTSEQ